MSNWKPLARGEKPAAGVVYSNRKTFTVDEVPSDILFTQVFPVIQRRGWWNSHLTDLETEVQRDLMAGEVVVFPVFSPC